MVNRDHPKAKKRKQVLGEPFHYLSVVTAHNTGQAMFRDKKIWGWEVEPQKEGGAFLRLFDSEDDKAGRLRLYDKSQSFRHAGNLGQLRLAEAIVGRFADDEELSEETRAYFRTAMKAISKGYEQVRIPFRGID